MSDSFVLYPEVPAISLELHNRCNLKCPYCGNKNLTRPRGEIQWELLEKLVDDCRGGRHNIAWLHGTGEPLLYKRLEEAIRLIRDNNAGAASFGTNGTLLTGDRTRKLLDAGLQSIYFSLDSLDPEVYKKTRGADLTKVIGNIRELLQIVPANFQVTVALMKSKVQQEIDSSRGEFNTLFGKYPNVVLKEIENTVFPASESDYRIVQGRHFGCSMPMNYFTIVCDGRVSICCVDQDVQVPIGDINTSTVGEIWLSAETQRRLAAVSFGEENCPEYCVEKCTMKRGGKDLSAGEKEVYVANLFAKGKNYFTAKKIETAAAFMDRVLEIMPDHAEAHNIKGIALFEKNEFLQATGHFEQAIKVNGSIPKYHFRQGLCQEILGNTDLAILCFERTLALQPDFQQAYLKLIENVRKRENLSGC